MLRWWKKKELVQREPRTLEQCTTTWLHCWEHNKKMEDWLPWAELHDALMMEKALPISQEQWYNAHPPRNINDPVLAILKAMRERPDTFDVSITEERVVRTLDTTTGWEFHFTKYIGSRLAVEDGIAFRRSVIEYNFMLLDWATKDEQDALAQEAERMLDNTEKKKKQEQRQAVMKMYCKGE